MKHPPRILISLASALSMVAAMPAAAGITTSSDRSAFLEATGATRATADLPNLGQIGGSRTFGKVSYAPVSGGCGWVVAAPSPTGPRC